VRDARIDFPPPDYTPLAGLAVKYRPPERVNLPADSQPPQQLCDSCRLVLGRCLSQRHRLRYRITDS